MKPFPKICIGAICLSATALAEPDVVIENQTFTSGQNKAFWATYTLQTMGTVVVQNNANLRLSAGNIIRLAPGFRLDAGGTLQITVQSNPAYNPGGYFSSAPTLAPISASNLYGATNSFGSTPIDIAIWNAAGTAPLVGAPVLITVEEGTGWLSATSGGALSRTLELTTDANGTVQAYVKHGGLAGAFTVVRVVAGDRSYLVWNQAYDPANANGADTDGDGLSGLLEAVLGTNPAVKAVVNTAPQLKVF